MCELWRRNGSDTCIAGESLFKLPVEKVNLINIVYGYFWRVCNVLMRL